MAFVMLDEPSRKTAPRFALFAYGFRPFFLAAGIYPVLSIAAWLGVVEGLWVMGNGSPILWHAHEMLFGFLVAAFAGFLLTAVPNWTGSTRLHGTPLLILFGLWLAGRIAMWLPVLPPAAVAAIDIAFLPALALAIGRPIWRKSRLRNGLFIILPLVFTASNLGFHAEMAGWDTLGLRSLHVAIALMLVAVTVIGGRIIPAFTQSGLRMAGRMVTLEASPHLDNAALATTIAVAVITALGLEGISASLCFAAAALAHALRLWRWRGWLAWRLPLVWILHLAYLWLVLGVALKALAAAGIVADQAGTHALTAGGMATMVLAVMTRASLGHTGRLLQVTRGVVAAYLLVTVGASARVLAVLLPGAGYQSALAVAGIAWIGGFALFVVLYAPMLVARRIDGRPG